MVGDGVNDAYPGQRWGCVGIRNHVARESADVVLIGNDLSKFVETINIATAAVASSCRISGGH
jgi:P-type Cu+ transporter